MHDAELVEKVWGDDLRVEGVVVELLDGADHLDEVVRGLRPRPGRRLGVLLDHLVDGSKESRIAAGVDHPDVLVTGHPYVDIWQAVKPSVLGIDAGPRCPRASRGRRACSRRSASSATPPAVLEAAARPGRRLDRPRAAAHRRGRAAHRLRDRTGLTRASSPTYASIVGGGRSAADGAEAATAARAAGRPPTATSTMPTRAAARPGPTQ